MSATAVCTNVLLDCRTKSTWTKRTAHRQKVFGQKVPGIGQKVPHFIKKSFLIIHNLSVYFTYICYSEYV